MGIYFVVDGISCDLSKRVGGSPTCVLVVAGNGDVAVTVRGPGVVDGKVYAGVSICEAWEDADPGEYMPEPTKNDLEKVKDAPVSLMFRTIASTNVFIDALKLVRQILSGEEIEKQKVYTTKEEAEQACGQLSWTEASHYWQGRSPNTTLPIAFVKRQVAS